MYLNIGPRYKKSNKNKIGGIIVQFEDFIGWLGENSLPTIVVDSNKKNYRNKVTAFIGILYKIIRAFPKAEYVIFHATFNDLIAFGPVIVILSKAMNKKLVIRKFAGSFKDSYQRSGFIRKAIIRFELKTAYMLLFETKYLVDFGLKFNANVHWFPNVRTKYLDEYVDRKYGKRLLFLSQIMKEKGIEIFTELKKRLPGDFIFTAVGPVVDTQYDKEYFLSKGVHYSGAVSPEQVREVLLAHDFLVLPTFWAGEGYPGVIIEAFSVGTPVIVTALNGTQEIIESGKNGLLFNLADLDQVSNFLLRMNDQIYTAMSIGAYRSFDAFNNSNVYKRTMDTIVNRNNYQDNAAAKDL